MIRLTNEERQLLEMYARTLGITPTELVRFWLWDLHQGGLDDLKRKISRLRK